MSDILSRVIETKEARYRFLDKEAAELFQAEKNRALGLFKSIIRGREYTEATVISGTGGLSRQYQSIAFGTQTVRGKEQNVFIEPSILQRDLAAEFPTHISLTALVAESAGVLYPRSQHGYHMPATGYEVANFVLTDKMGQFGLTQAEMDAVNDFNGTAQAIAEIIQV